MATMEIKRLQKDELAAYLALQKQTFLKNGDTEGPVMETIEQVKQDFQTTDMYKIMLDDKMIGGICIGCISQEQYRIHRFFIASAYQHQHYGKEALQRLMKVYPWEVLSLDTPAHQHRNLHFYKSMGFEVVYNKRVSERYELSELEIRRKLT